MVIQQEKARRSVHRLWTRLPAKMLILAARSAPMELICWLRSRDCGHSSVPDAHCEGGAVGGAR